MPVTHTTGRDYIITHETADPLVLSGFIRAATPISLPNSSLIRHLDPMTRIFRQDGVRGLWVQYWQQVKELSLDAWSWVASHPNLAFSPIGVFGVIYLLRIQ
jgi:hypothetical protein